MKRVAVLALLIPLLLAQSCPERKFEVAMERTPNGGVQRDLTIWVASEGKILQPGEDMLARAQEAYGRPGQAVGEKRRFSGEFGAQPPADLVHEDLTNHVIHSVSESPLGRVSTYVERMPGRTDLIELGRTAERFADTFVRAWVAWARQQPELRAEPEKLNRLVRFAQTELRDDVLNTLLTGWQAFVQLQGAADGGVQLNDADEQAWKRAGWRLVLYAVERGYLNAAEVSADPESIAPVLLRGILEKIARVSAYPGAEGLPGPLAQLADPEKCKAAFEAGLKDIGMTMEDFQELLEPAMPEFFGGGTSGQVTWRCDTQPFSTNGAWDAEKNELTWEAEGRSGCVPPQILFAVWAEPDEAYQRAHFGDVTVRGDALPKYNGWRQELSAGQRAEWDTFVNGLHPGPDLTDKLSEFRFRTADRRPATQPVDEPTRGASILLEGLKVATPPAVGD